MWMIPADGILEASDLFGRLDVGSHVLVAKQTMYLVRLNVIYL